MTRVKKTKNFDSAIAKKEAVKRLQDIYISYKPHSFEETDNIQKSESKKNLSMFARFMKPGPIIEDSRNNNEIKNFSFFNVVVFIRKIVSIN